MNESIILDEVLDILDSEGEEAAYAHLLNQYMPSKNYSSQYYNYLYCIAALCNKKEEAIHWLEEAIETKGYWYRPVVFEDEDLYGIRNTEAFKNCEKISNKRYKLALKEAKTLCSWKMKSSDKIALVLHGNQQNMSDSLNDWAFLTNDGYQVEGIQSVELDSYNLYRWEDDGNGAIQLAKALLSLPWRDYDETILCGFSAGCNTILRAIVDEDVKCSRIILQSPWIPMIEQSLTKVIQHIKQKNIKVHILCGVEDEDCYQVSQRLYKALDTSGIGVDVDFIEKLGHAFPINVERLVTTKLSQKDQK